MTDDGTAGELGEVVDKMVLDVADLKEQMANLNGVMRSIAATQARRENKLADIFLAAVAILLVMLLGTAALYSWLIANPWPFTLQVPPPHSTQYPQEVPKQ